MLGLVDFAPPNRRGRRNLVRPALSTLLQSDYGSDAAAVFMLCSEKGRNSPRCGDCGKASVLSLSGSISRNSISKAHFDLD